MDNACAYINLPLSEARTLSLMLLISLLLLFFKLVYTFKSKSIVYRWKMHQWHLKFKVTIELAHTINRLYVNTPEFNNRSECTTGFNLIPDEHFILQFSSNITFHISSKL